jgi:hypothetical protein
VSNLGTAVVEKDQLGIFTKLLVRKIRCREKSLQYIMLTVPPFDEVSLHYKDDSISKHGLTFPNIPDDPGCDEEKVKCSRFFQF